MPARSWKVRRNAGRGDRGTQTLSSPALSPRAAKDLENVARGDRQVAKRLAGAILAHVKALPGRSPWRRLRVGDWRIVYRPLEQRELQALSRLRGESVDAGTVIVERIVNRRELERIIAALP